MSDPARWLELERLYHAALERPLQDRASFAEQACAHDEWLRNELESMLRNDQPDDDFLDQPAIGVAATELAANEGEPASIQLGSLIGAYKIVELIARGGMGVVYRAEQQYPVRRNVALKIIKPGMDSEQVIARFEAERQALALMDHPNIARVLDAGATSLGRLYFVMELVDGVPITQYCEQHELDLRERLGIFIPVCQAIQHAHQKSVIHRDIKPSNVLVTIYDGQPVPKVIDFGIAKAMQEPLTERSMHTQAGAVIGTLEYMSPEQAGGFTEDVDTRSDVYSLGAVLYEMIAGSTPLSSHSLRNSSEFDIVRRIREEDPPPPSARMGKVKASRTVNGDLDWVVMKALEKDRGRRYETVNGLMRDLQRYLAQEPVEAAPPSVSYRVHKFVRRHRIALLTVAAFAALLIAGLVVSFRMAIRASRAEEAAIAVNHFLQNDILAQASAANQAGPGARPDPDLKVRTALDRAAARLAGKFDRQPDAEAAIRDTIGRAYLDIGLYPEARKQLELALDLQRRILGTGNSKTIDILSDLGHTARRQGKYDEAGSLFNEAIPLARRVLGPESPDTLRALNGLAAVYTAQGKYAQAEALLRQTLEIRQRRLGREHPDALESMRDLARACSGQAKYAEAEALLTQVVDARRRVLGPEHPDTLQAMIPLAHSYCSRGDYPAAEKLYRQTLEIQRRVLGPHHPDALDCMYRLAYNALPFLGKYREAEELYTQTLAVQRRTLGPEHRDTLRTMGGLGTVYSAQGKYAQAEAMHSQTLEIRRRALGTEHPDTLGSMGDLGKDYLWQGKYAQAEAMFSQAMDTSRRMLGPENPTVVSSLSELAALYQRQGRYDQASACAEKALDALRRTHGPDVDIMNAAADLALAYLSQGKFIESEALAREAVESDGKSRPDHWQRFRAMSLLGASLAGEKKYAEAELPLLTGYQGMAARKERMEVPNFYHLDRAREWIVRLNQLRASR